MAVFHAKRNSVISVCCLENAEHGIIKLLLFCQSALAIKLFWGELVCCPGGRLPPRVTVLPLRYLF